MLGSHLLRSTELIKLKKLCMATLIDDDTE